MDKLCVKLCGLNDADRKAFQSVLTLSTSRLTAPWQCIESGQADLEIYNFDAPEANIAWQTRQPGCFTASLNSENTVIAAVDIVLKKPLRTSQLISTLNLIHAKRQPNGAKAILQKQSDYVLSPLTPTPKAITFGTRIQNLFFSTLFSYRPAAGLPSLSFELPDLSHDKLPNGLLDEKRLLNWLEALPKHPFERIQVLHDRLLILAKHRLPTRTAYRLLPHYMNTLKTLVFEHEGGVLRAGQHDIISQRNVVTLLTATLGNLSLCYQRIAKYFYLRGQRPHRQPLYLYSLNQSTELLIWSALWGFHHYQIPTPGLIKQINQLFYYHESAKALNIHPQDSQRNYLPTFKTRYLQFLLVGLTDPYSLPKFTALKLYKLFENICGELVIQQPTEQQKQLSGDFLLTGHFFVDLAHDNFPIDITEATDAQRESKSARVLNLQPLLQALRETANSQLLANMKQVDRMLLMDIVPKLNASYMSLADQLPAVEPHDITVTQGLPNIYRQILKVDPVGDSSWQVIKASDKGIQATHTQTEIGKSSIGEILMVFLPNQSAKLGFLTRLRIDDKKQSQVVISLLDETFVVAKLQTIDQKNNAPCLVIESESDSTIIAPRGVHSERRQFYLQTRHKRELIQVDRLLNRHQEYEYFHYHRLRV